MPAVAAKRFDRSIVEGPISGAVWTLAWPTVLQNVIGGLQGVVDHAMVGHYVGYAGNAAVGVSLRRSGSVADCVTVVRSPGVAPVLELLSSTDAAWLVVVPLHHRLRRDATAVIAATIGAGVVDSASCQADTAGPDPSRTMPRRKGRNRRAQGMAQILP